MAGDDLQVDLVNRLRLMKHPDLLCVTLAKVSVVPNSILLMILCNQSLTPARIRRSYFLCFSCFSWLILFTTKFTEEPNFRISRSVSQLAMAAINPSSESWGRNLLSTPSTGISAKTWRRYEFANVLCFAGFLSTGRVGVRPMVSSLWPRFETFWDRLVSSTPRGLDAIEVR